MKATPILLQAIICLTLLCSCTPQEPKATDEMSAEVHELFLLNATDLDNTRERYRSGEIPYTAAVAKLTAEADSFLSIPAPTIIHKKKLPVSGDPHDYYSMGPYWWPDSTKEDGLPYVRRDGYRNPEIYGFDRPALRDLQNAVLPMTLAWFYTGEKKYADHAVNYLNTFFLNPETHMNPHLEYGQAIPGIVDGRGIGLIETGRLVEIIDATLILHEAGQLSDDQYNGMTDWFADFAEWMANSKKGIDERMWHNNHGSSYDSQLATYAAFTGMDSLSRLILDSVTIKRIDRQIEPDGSQPWELERTKAMGYSIKNLHHLMENATLAARNGDDLWSYESETGGSILGALRYLTQFYVSDTKFPYEQIGGIGHYSGELRELLQIAAHDSGKQEYRQLLEAFPEKLDDDSYLHLLYPLK